MSNDEKYFSPNIFAWLAAKEEDYWWFRGRTQMILWVLRNKIGSFRNFLEVGCGTGFVLRSIRKDYPHAELYGSEYYEEALAYAQKRIPSGTLTQFDATQMDETSCYDVIGAFDVLEHIWDDDKVLNNLARGLKSRGALVITVPQHQWLWSMADEYACHFRRYTSTELANKAKNAGLRVEYMTSFVSLLVPLMWLARLRANQHDYDPRSQFRIPDWLNKCLEAIMHIELGLMKLGWHFPIGGSLLVVAKKHDSVQ